MGFQGPRVGQAPRPLGFCLCPVSSSGPPWSECQAPGDGSLLPGPLRLGDCALQVHPQKLRARASLVVQWLGICLQSRGHGFDPWSGKIPCASRQQSSRATTTEPVLCKEKPPQ